MAKLEWDKTEDRHYENGVDHGVLYTEAEAGFNPFEESTFKLFIPDHEGAEDVDPSTFPAEADSLKAANLYDGTLSSGNIDDATGEELAGSGKRTGYMSFPSGTYAVYFYCANDIFPLDVFWYSDDAYISHEIVRIRDSDGYGYAVCPQNSTRVRLVISDSTKTANSLYVDIEPNEGDDISNGIPSSNIFSWESFCTVYHPEEEYVPTPSDYSYGGRVYKGVAWNGLTSVTESPDGAEPNDLWGDNIKYATMRSTETFGATIEAYQAPAEFGECDGTSSPLAGVFLGQQKRKPFGFAYRTRTESDDIYNLHLIYNATASPSERGYETLNDSPDAITFSWELTTTPVKISGHKPTSTVVVSSDLYKYDRMSRFFPEICLDVTNPLDILEIFMFGSPVSVPFLPSPEFVKRIFSNTIGMKLLLPSIEPTPNTGYLRVQNTDRNPRVTIIGGRPTYYTVGASNYSTYFAECSPGEVFTFYGCAASNEAPGYMFIASDGTVLKRYMSSTLRATQVIVAPEGTAYVYFLKTETGYSSYNLLCKGNLE